MINLTEDLRNLYTKYMNCGEEDESELYRELSLLIGLLSLVEKDSFAAESKYRLALKEWWNSKA